MKHKVDNKGILVSMDRKQPRKSIVVELNDGSKPYTTTDSSYLQQHLSDLDLEVIKQQEAQGISFSHLTESQVVDQFL